MYSTRIVPSDPWVKDSMKVQKYIINFYLEIAKYILSSEDGTSMMNQSGVNVNQVFNWVQPGWKAGPVKGTEQAAELTVE